MIEVVKRQSPNKHLFFEMVIVLAVCDLNVRGHSRCKAGNYMWYKGMKLETCSKSTEGSGSEEVFGLRCELISRRSGTEIDCSLHSKIVIWIFDSFSSSWLIYIK